jgi:hypothetical protein
VKQPNSDCCDAVRVKPATIGPGRHQQQAGSDAGGDGGAGGGVWSKVS